MWILVGVRGSLSGMRVCVADREPRDLAREQLQGFLTPEKLDVLLNEVLEIKKGARGWCPSCRRAVPVEISDAKAVVSALGELLTQAYGRPGQEVGEDSGER